MQDSVALVLLALLSHDAETPAPIVQSTPRKGKVAKTGKAIKLKGGKLVEEDDTKAPPVPVVLPPAQVAPGIAKAFISRLASAKDRAEEAAATDLFYFAAVCNDGSPSTPLAYNATLPHGTQIDLARWTAQHSIAPVKGKAHSRAGATIAGYVAGMPDHLDKVIRDLESRERVAIDVICNFVAQENNPSLTEQELALIKGRVLVEQARLDAIRTELARLR